MYSISYRAEKRLSVTERTVRMDVGPEDTHHSYLCQSNGHLYLPTVRRIESFIKELRERAERLTGGCRPVPKLGSFEIDLCSAKVASACLHPSRCTTAGRRRSSKVANRCSWTSSKPIQSVL